LKGSIITKLSFDTISEWLHVNCSCDESKYYYKCEVNERLESGVLYKYYKMYFVHKKRYLNNAVSQLIIFYDMMCTITNTKTTSVTYKYDNLYQEYTYLFSFYETYDTLYHRYRDELPDNTLLFFIAWIWLQ